MKWNRFDGRAPAKILSGESRGESEFGRSQGFEILTQDVTIDQRIANNQHGLILAKIGCLVKLHLHGFVPSATNVG